MASNRLKVSSEVGRRVGVVVIGRNEGERLLQCLAIAKEQCEHVVYADSASSDGSVAGAAGLAVAVVEIAPDRPMTAGRGRRLGFDRLIADAPDLDYVQFVDGDCLLQAGWLETACRFLDEHPTVAVVCGRRFEAKPKDSFYNRLIDSEWDTPIGEAVACGGDSLMRVAPLTQVGSFRADLVAGEEPELCNRLRRAGWTIWRIDAAMSEHDARITDFAQWWRRSLRGGFGYAQVWDATRGSSQPLYRRQMVSAVFWAAVIPVVAVAVAIATGNAGWLLLVPALYAFQIARIALRNRRNGVANPVKSATVTMVIKIAELIGVARYWLKGASGQAATYRGEPAGSRVDAGMAR